MIRIKKSIFLALARPCRIPIFLLGLACGQAYAAGPTSDQVKDVSQGPAKAATSLAAKPSEGAERIFASSRAKLLQIRTLTRASRSQSSIGSGFMVAPDIAVTNYHVVSQKVMQNEQYELQWLSVDNQQGALTVLAVDIANDLALVRVAQTERLGQSTGKAPAQFVLAAAEPERGQRVYSMGRPLDLGFNVIEGTHNGRVDGDFNQRFLFSGAINSGMSGGPAVNARGEVYGINVAKNRNGELVSYVVPVQFARALLQRQSSANTASTANAAPSVDFLPAMSQQLHAHQQRLMDAMFAKPLTTRQLGRYQVPTEVPPLLRCWANTTRAESKIPYSEDQVQCRVDAYVYVDDTLNTGTVQFTHRLVSSRELSRTQFQSLITQRHRPAQLGIIRQHLTPDRCSDEFVSSKGLNLRITLCAQALKKFPGLYDFGLSATTLDAHQVSNKDQRQSLISSIHMDGVSWDNGTAMARRFLEALALAQVAP